MLLEDYKFTFGKVYITIPKGYAFDWLSIPQACQWIVNMNDTQNIKAGLEHDYLYSELAKDICDKNEADEHLETRVKAWKVRKRVVYLWVHYFWHSAYRKDTNYRLYEKEIKEAREKLGFQISIS